MKPLPLLLFVFMIACDPKGDTGQAHTSETETETDSAEPEGDEGPPSEPLDFTKFEDPESCATCHPDQYDEWRQSMHAYAAKSPVFDAMAAKAFRDTSGAIGTFCTGCHTPIGTYEGEPGWTATDDRSPKSQQGVSCDYCHSVTNHTGIVGNANLEASPTSVKYGPYLSTYEGEHSTAQSSFIQSPEFCGSCHDVFIFPGIRSEDAYTEYIESPAVASGLRCQDCHMGPVPGAVTPREMGPSAIVDGVPSEDRERSNHLFVGPDYSLIDGFPYPDDLAASATAQAASLTQIQTLLENAAEIDDLDVIFDGDEGTISVTARSLTPGHRVPTGFTSERQMWLAVTVKDTSGAVVWQSGDLDANDDLRDEHSWQVKSGEVPLDSALVNFQSENITIWRYWSEDGTFSEEGVGGSFGSIFPFDASAIFRHSLEPLEERAIRFDFDGVTEDEVGEITVALKFRNLPPYFLRALQLDDLVDRLQIFTIDTETLSFE